jgi:hypothetical protein
LIDVRPPAESDRVPVFTASPRRWRRAQVRVIPPPRPIGRVQAYACFALVVLAANRDGASLRAHRIDFVVTGDSADAVRHATDLLPGHADESLVNSATYRRCAVP